MSTEFYQQTAAGARGRTTVLANWPAQFPTALYQPYVGDYQQLVTTGNIFWGAFPASNEVKRANFFSGVFYQRHVNIRGEVKSNLWLNADGELDKGTGQVPDGDIPDPMLRPARGVSIDPYFFTAPAISP
jgi:hypothetical protein